MKQQNCILRALKGGICTEFERFTCKRPQTVLNKFKKAYGIFIDSCILDGYRDADVIRIIATPDGYTDGETLAEYTPKEFFEAIL